MQQLRGAILSCMLAACGAVSGQETPDAALPDAPPPVCTDGATEACYSGPSATVGRGVCASGTRTCTGGQWSATCDGEVVPAGEICDGEDDDCDDAVDDGCPQAGATQRGQATALPLVGGTTTHGTENTMFAHACPIGQAIIGFRALSHDAIDRIAVICAQVNVVQTGATGSPRTFTTTRGTLSVSAPYGNTVAGTDVDTICASGVVIGATTWQGDVPNAGVSISYGMTLTCSDLAASGTPGDPVLRPAGTPTETARIANGTPSVSPSRVDSACPAGTAMTGVTGYFGPWPVYAPFTTINAFAFECAELRALLEPTVE